MPVANHSRVRLFARKRTNECNANAMRICERQVYASVCGGITRVSAQRWCVRAAYVTVYTRRADHSVIN